MTGLRDDKKRDEEEDAEKVEEAEEAELFLYIKHNSINRHFLFYRSEYGSDSSVHAPFLLPSRS